MVTVFFQVFDHFSIKEMLPPKRMEMPHKTVKDEELKILDSYITKI